ncbi:hypothetical protein LSCM1_06272 [Leishmania martiniquensis]|uniref:Uncharacterized protein n=1 Tax=Leishmania martiniquensis TaxID=1580590 RepID=A0A836HPY4_9TRYP|nr:hypothetical protein LSCM1_06272 [Leishmania martiniquensis]
MDVLLHVVQTTSASPVTVSRLCDDDRQHTSLGSPAALSASSYGSSFTVEALRLSRAEGRLSGGVAARWDVSLCSPAEDESASGCDGNPQMLASERPPASLPLHISSSSVTVAADAVDITTPRGRRPPDCPATTAAADFASQKLCRLREAFVEVADSDGLPVSLVEIIFFCGSRRGTRKDALYLTTLHRLVVEALLWVEGRPPPTPSPSPKHVDVSLVDYDEVWGAGDVLAAEVARPSSKSTQGQRSQITWMPLAKVLECASGPRSVVTATSDTALPRSASLTEPSCMTLARTKSDINVAHVAQVVRQRLQVWFGRIDSATSAFPSPPALPSPPSAVDRLRHLDRNVVLFTLRLRSGTSSSAPAEDSRFRAAYFTLVLLPECGAAPFPLHGATGTVAAAMGASPRRATAMLWREFEALSAFMRSLPPSRPRRRDDKQTRVSPSERSRTSAATWQAHMRAAALRRSRWLTTIARIHDPLAPLTGAWATETGEHGADDALDRFLKRSAARSFSWIGCIAAAASHQRATRSTLAFLARLQTSQLAQRGRPKSANDRLPESPTGTPLAQHDCPHPKNVKERNASSAQEASSSSSTSTPPPPSPIPSANVPQPYVSPSLHGVCATSSISSGKVGTAGASHLPLSNERSTTMDPVAPPSPAHHARHGAGDSHVSSRDIGHEPASPPASVDALIASLRAYASVLEKDVQRLRRRLQRYEATPCADRVSTGELPGSSPLPQAPECGSLNTLMSVSAPDATLPHIYAPLPPSVRAAMDDLRSDARFPRALHGKLDALAQRMASACTAALQTRENTDVRGAYVAQLESKLALYEGKLALIDDYVAPAVMQCVKDLDHWQQCQRRRQPKRTALTETAPTPPSSHPTLLPEWYQEGRVGEAEYAPSP